MIDSVYVTSGSAFLLSRYSSHLCHASAFLGTTLAVIHLMFGAFFRASLANLCTKTANSLSKLTASSHITGRDAANFSAIQIQLYASCHAPDVLLIKAVLTWLTGVNAHMKRCILQHDNFVIVQSWFRQ
ncbi:hypothetical protein [Oligella urethralis]|uniref:hypothetical protein n=1 Tax=Oligella urethralis TaxID=90245 RepID=UPI00215D90BD|nr:hypothetical protein [Oligella urethralis]